MGIFDFFKKKVSEEPPEESQDDDDINTGSDGELQASISYFILSDGVPRIDIEIKDYTEDTIGNLCVLLLSLNMDETYIETLEMIKEGLVKEGREDVFAKVSSQISAAVLLSELTSSSTTAAKNVGEDPCINPSEVL
jgi:hypothetical protein